MRVIKSEPKQKEVWIVDLGDHIPNSSIQRGKKPCIMISNVNESEIDEIPCRMITVGPLTTKLKNMHMPTHTLITKEEGLREDSCFLGEQTTSTFVEKCLWKVSEVNDETFERLYHCVLRSMYDEKELKEKLILWNSSDTIDREN